MGPLIKITTEPLQMMRFTQNARLVNSDSVDIERRKAVARHMTMRRANPNVQGNVSVKDITKINQAFSQSKAEAEIAQAVSPQVVSRQTAQAAMQAPVHQKVSAPTPAPDMSVDMAESNTAPELSAAASSAVAPDLSIESSTSYTAQRGAFEMRVARGDLTYLPPLVMTVITQRPQIHVEYLGGFNYVPPLDVDPGRNVNLFT